ncbi:MAG: dienelactone hydrolase family protein [Candidatus Dormiibacterota bacterium]
MTEVTYSSRGGSGRAYLAVPRSGGPWPGVVVIMDVLGMSNDLRQQCDRLASHGYLALAPDLYSWGPKIVCIRATFAALRRGSGRAFQDIEAARTWLGARSDCTNKVGVIGFCMGGGFALLVAPQFGFAASSVNYGQVPKDSDRLLLGSCPIVGSYGGRDRILKGHAERLEATLQRLGVDHDVKEYPDASHGFMNRHGGALGAMVRVLGVGYEADSAEDAWRRILSFFDRHLGTGVRSGGAESDLGGTLSEEASASS